MAGDALAYSCLTAMDELEFIFPYLPTPPHISPHLPTSQVMHYSYLTAMDELEFEEEDPRRMTT